MSASMAIPPAARITVHAEPYHPSLGILDPLPTASRAWVTTLLVDDEPKAMAVVSGPTDAIPTPIAAVVVVREALASGDRLSVERPYLPGFTAETVLRSRIGHVDTPAGPVRVRVCTATTFEEFENDGADTARWADWVAAPWTSATHDDPLARLLGDADAPIA